MQKHVKRRLFISKIKNAKEELITSDPPVVTHDKIKLIKN
jgi:hypothetical protein